MATPCSLQCEPRCGHSDSVGKAIIVQLQQGVLCVPTTSKLQRSHGQSWIVWSNLLIKISSLFFLEKTAESGSVTVMPPQCSSRRWSGPLFLQPTEKPVSDSYWARRKMSPEHSLLIQWVQCVLWDSSGELHLFAAAGPYAVTGKAKAELKRDSLQGH